MNLDALIELIKNKEFEKVKEMIRTELVLPAHNKKDEMQKCWDSLVILLQYLQFKQSIEEDRSTKITLDEIIASVNVKFFEIMKQALRSQRINDLTRWVIRYFTQDAIREREIERITFITNEIFKVRGEARDPFWDALIIKGIESNDFEIVKLFAPYLTPDSEAKEDMGEWRDVEDAKYERFSSKFVTLIDSHGTQIHSFSHLVHFLVHLYPLTPKQGVDERPVMFEPDHLLDTHVEGFTGDEAAKLLKEKELPTAKGIYIIDRIKHKKMDMVIIVHPNKIRIKICDYVQRYGDEGRQAQDISVKLLNKELYTMFDSYKKFLIHPDVANALVKSHHAFKKISRKQVPLTHSILNFFDAYERPRVLALSRMNLSEYLDDQDERNYRPRKKIAQDVTLDNASGELYVVEIVRKPKDFKGMVDALAVMGVFRGYASTSKKRYIVKKYFRGQPLWQYLQKNKKTELPEKLRFSIAMLCEVFQLHVGEITHGDLHPGNIIVERTLQCCAVIDMLEGAGVHQYTAPEIMKNASIPQDEKIIYDVVSDVYSLGRMIGILFDFCEYNVLRATTPKLTWQWKEKGDGGLPIVHRIYEGMVAEDPHQRFTLHESIRALFTIYTQHNPSCYWNLLDKLCNEKYMKYSFLLLNECVETLSRQSHIFPVIDLNDSDALHTLKDNLVVSITPFLETVPRACPQSSVGL